MESEVGAMEGLVLERVSSPDCREEVAGHHMFSLFLPERRQFVSDWPPTRL